MLFKVRFLWAEPPDRSSPDAFDWLYSNLWYRLIDPHLSNTPLNTSTLTHGMVLYYAPISVQQELSATSWVTDWSPGPSARDNESFAWKAKILYYNILSIKQSSMYSSHFQLVYVTHPEHHALALKWLCSALRWKLKGWRCEEDVVTELLKCCAWSATSYMRSATCVANSFV
jgi:hypothetical protein